MSPRRGSPNLAYATQVRSGPELRELNPGQFVAELDELTAIYALAMDAPPGQLPARRSIMERHAGYPAFRAVMAVRPAQDAGPPAGQAPPVGFAYGFHGAAGQWWHDVVRDTLISHRGDEIARYWLADSFEIAEVHVHPSHQGGGIGRAMMHSLVAGRLERVALLSTPDGHTRARRLYHSLGFTDLVPGFCFPGSSPSYAIMGAALPLRDARPPPADRSASPSR
jgi:ribosomal protein S18 acetylase RimI-like enzyme